MSEKYYVYVYIDPRNFEEFYNGKGTGARKDAHLFEDNDSDKVARIKAIRAENREPIIRVIAQGLSEEQALMVETALIWKLGRNLTNIASGHYVSRFRPPDTFHKRLAHFDFQNGIYYANVGEGPHRNWDDCRTYGFLAAGWGPPLSGQLQSYEIGDVIVAYLAGHGYVGVGTVTARAVPFREYRHEGRALNPTDMVEPGIGHDADDLSVCEYLLAVRWNKAVAREAAAWKPKSDLFAKQPVKASLDAQPATVQFVEQEFGVDLGTLADVSATGR